MISDEIKKITQVNDVRILKLRTRTAKSDKTIYTAKEIVETSETIEYERFKSIVS